MNSATTASPLSIASTGTRNAVETAIELSIVDQCSTWAKLAKYMPPKPPTRREVKDRPRERGQSM